MAVPKNKFLREQTKKETTENGIREKTEQKKAKK